MERIGTQPDSARWAAAHALSEEHDQTAAAERV